jgi:hypothetical protein
VIHLGRREPVTLLDSVNHHSVDYYVVWRTVPRERAIWWRLLKPGFYHVEVWGFIPPGAWIRFDTSVELTAVEVYSDPPWVLVGPNEAPTIMHYQALVPHGRIRQPFYFGPMTCVTLSASFLGIRLPFWCRTPWQFYKLLARQHESQISEAAG